MDQDTEAHPAADELHLLPDHESAVRRMVSDAAGHSYIAVRSLEEAKRYPDGAVVLEGDWGGQIFLTCPAQLVQCTEQTLQQLLSDLNETAWPGQEEGMGVFYERLPVGAGVAGGMGGAAIQGDIWVHQEFDKLGIAP